MTRRNELANYCNDLAQEMMADFDKRLAQDGFNNDSDIPPIVLTVAVHIIRTLFSRMNEHYPQAFAVSYPLLKRQIEEQLEDMRP